jgi:hypothetical protein
MTNLFDRDTGNSLDAMEKAQMIAFAPVMFHATVALRDLGILQMIDARTTGLTADEIQQQSGLSRYGVRVLLEAGLGIGLLTLKDGVYNTTRLTYFILNDNMTRANMDFARDICYDGVARLKESVESGKPEGLRHFGEGWNTVYEALASLPENKRRSWFAFDHFYSDNCFPLVLPVIFGNKKPARMLDIGGNTGKWTLQCLEYDAAVNMGIADLPGQLHVARKNISVAGLTHRVQFHEMNILSPGAGIPRGYDVIWMSQFLDCFSEDEIVSILIKCREALHPNAEIVILEAFWDRQRFRAAAFTLQMTSLYFTAVANGNSQMYGGDLFISLVEKAGLKVVEEVNGIGLSHTLIRCVPA